MKDLSILILGIVMGFILGVVIANEYKIEEPIRKQTTQQKIDSLQSEITDLKWLKTLKEYEKIKQEELKWKLCNLKQIQTTY